MGNFRIPPPKNEPILNYAPGSPERAGIEKALAELKAAPIEIPMYIGGKEVRTGTKLEIRSPHNHKLLLAHYYQGGEQEVKAAVGACMEAAKTWSVLPWEHRAAIFLKAADLMAGPYRYIMNAACMLAHSKNIFQAE
ncbi:1-pyrroline-5-carboxylate dehydrogenase, partial [candidate division GN15 bacterium]